MKILAMSDQHGFLPNIPPCDLLIVAGDNCYDKPPGALLYARNDSRWQLRWFRTEWLAWRRRQPAAMCVVTFGNHDYCGEDLMMAHSPKTHWQMDETTIAVIDGLVEYKGLKIWLTPWSSRFQDWAFMHSEDRLVERYAQIPTGLDILVSHQPMAGWRDGSLTVSSASGLLDLGIGSKALRAAVDRTQPKTLICGHVHHGYGYADYWHPGNRLTRVYNVALVDEAYQLVNQPTEIRVGDD